MGDPQASRYCGGVASHTEGAPHGACGEGRALGLSRVAGCRCCCGGHGAAEQGRLVGRSCEAVVRGPKRMLSAPCVPGRHETPPMRNPACERQQQQLPELPPGPAGRHLQVADPCPRPPYPVGAGPGPGPPPCRSVTRAQPRGSAKPQTALLSSFFYPSASCLYLVDKDGFFLARLY